MRRSWLGWIKRTSRRTRVIAAATAGSLTLLIWAVLAGHLLALLLLSLTGAGVVALGVAVRREQKVRKAKIEAAVGRTTWPRRVGPWLLPREHVDWEGRKHPFAVLRWWTLLFGGPLLGIVLGIFASSWFVFFIFLVIPPLIASVPILNWWLDWRTITNGRIMEIKGILNIKAPAMPLNKLLNAYPEESLLSRIIGSVGLPRYYRIKLETAAQVESIPELDFVRDPQVVNELLQSKFMPSSNDGT